MYKRQDQALAIKAPAPWAQSYKELLINYHDVISKGKFDLGFTDVVEHKIDMRDDDPVHIRQFRIPLEHRQTIYDWVDELLKKGAIEVSQHIQLPHLPGAQTARQRHARRLGLQSGQPEVQT